MIRGPEMELEIFPPFGGFSKKCFSFFRQLKRNNSRKWFEEHRKAFEENVRFPMCSFVASLQPHFGRFAPEFDLNPKRSIFRIYRDIRFSPDKTPYKTHIAAHFVLKGKPKGFLGSGYYVEIAPGESYTGGGIYIPDSGQLNKIRKAISENGKEFLDIVENKKFKRLFSPFEWSSLKRMPTGYTEDNPMAEWLKYKQFFVGVSWHEHECYRKNFVDNAADIFEALTPLVRFINGSLL
jgi:uncharacterized protein (TIGR02453 family)